MSKRSAYISIFTFHSFTNDRNIYKQVLQDDFGKKRKEKKKKKKQIRKINTVCQITCACTVKLISQKKKKENGEEKKKKKAMGKKKKKTSYSQSDAFH